MTLQMVAKTKAKVLIQTTEKSVFLERVCWFHGPDWIHTISIVAEVCNKTYGEYISMNFRRY